MSQDALEQARRRVAPFLLPALRDLLVDSTEDLSFALKKSNSAMALARASIRVSQEVTPLVDEIARSVCDRLDMPRTAIDVYIFPGAELSAFCFLKNHPIVVGLSSHLVNSLPGDELAFVLGHEIGHALFRETQFFVPNPSSLEDQIVARSVELSVDRVGLLASGDKEAAFRAILKTLSGLGDAHLRFDFSHYMQEARAVLEDPVSEQQLWSSHPPLAERFRALVSFSLSDVYLTTVNSAVGAKSAGIPIDQTNRQLANGLNAIVDKEARRIIDRQLDDLGIWVCTLAVRNEKTVNLTNLREHCSLALKKEDLHRAVQLVESLDAPNQNSLCREKINEELQKALRLAPRRTYKLIEAIRREIPDIQFQVMQASSSLTPI